MRVILKNVEPAKKASVNGFVNYALVLMAYLLLQVLIGQGMVSNAMQSLLVPVCCYIVMAVSLNLVVGVSGELSLGHGGFMSLGAFSGIVAAAALQAAIPSAPLRLAAAMLVGAVAGAVGGVIIGVPVLRLQGDYLAIVTLAFGQIIQNIIMILYVGIDAGGLHLSIKDEASLHLAEGGVSIIKGPMGAVGVTKLASTGGFLRDGNTTLMIGVDDDKVDVVMDILKENCAKRTETEIVMPHGTGGIPAWGVGVTPMKVEVGGATVFVLDVAEFRKL